MERFLEKSQNPGEDVTHKTRGTKEVAAGSCCSIRLEAKKWVEALRWADAARFAEAAGNEKPSSKDLEEEVNRRQYTNMHMEKERSGTSWKSWKGSRS